MTCRRSWSLGVVCLLGIPLLQGCFFWLYEPPPCWSSFGSLVLGVEVLPGHTRADFGFDVAIEREALGSDAALALRQDSTLRVTFLVETGTVTIHESRILEDGEVLARGTSEVTLENVMADCHAGTCARELDVWVAVEGSGTIEASGFVEIPEEDCTEEAGIVATLRHVENLPDVPAPPPGRPLPPLPPPGPSDPPPVCSGDGRVGCVHACSDPDCVEACLVREHDDDCLTCIVDAERDCSLEYCGAELFDHTRCIETTCRGEDRCVECEDQRAALETCTEAARVAHCADASAVCF